MRRKSIISAVLVLMLLFGTVGCAKQTEGDSGKGETKKEVELRFMDINPNPEREKAFQDIIGKFNDEHEGIKVVYESVPWDQSHNKLVTLGSAGNLPDVFLMHQQWQPEFTSAEWVKPLDDYIETWEYKDDILPYVKNVLMDYDQKDTYGYTFGMPDGMTLHGLFVRTDWMKDAGLTREDLSTWDGVFDAAEKMTIPEKNQYGFAYRGARMGSEQMGMYLLGALGGKLYEDDGTCRINTPEGIEAFKRYCSLYLDGYSPKDSINWGYSEMVQGFTSGLSGIMNQTTEVSATCKDTMDDSVWTVLPFPRMPDGNIYCKADGYYMTMSNTTEHPDEAWEFISYMLTPENNRDICEANYTIPVMQGAEDDPRFAEGPLSGFLEGLQDEHFVREPYYGYFPELAEFQETIYDNEVQRYLLGQQTAEESVKNISDFLTNAQQKYMKENPDTPIPTSVNIKGESLQ